MATGVLLLHGLALQGLVAGHGAAAGAPPPLVTTSVRTLPAPPPAPTPAAPGPVELAPELQAPAATPVPPRSAPALAETTAQRAAAAPPPRLAAAEPGAAVGEARPAGPRPAEPAEAAEPASPAALPAPLPGDTPPSAPDAAPVLLAQAGGPAVALPATARPLPRYRASLPPPFEARFQMRRGMLSGQADWSFVPDGAGYRLELHTRVLGREVSHLRSEGRLAAAGLEPVRFVDGRRGRDQRAVNFQRDAPGGGLISFSGPATQLPLQPGVQDRLSWLLQLAAIVDADAGLQRRGAQVSMWVVSPRGEADLWSFAVTGEEVLALDDGSRRTTLALKRAPDRAFDTEVQVWLDPGARHLPLRATWRNEGDGAAVDLRREALAWR